MAIREIFLPNTRMSSSRKCEPDCDTGHWECNPDYCLPDAYDTPGSDGCDPFEDDV